MKREELAEAASKLPFKPGVYLMLDKAGEVIYVGKAKLLRNRVSSYFRASGHENAKTQTLVAHIDRFDIIVCQSEFEALVTESTLIKQHKPRYNILLKDDKGYPYAAIDMASSYPRFELIGKPLNDKRLYLGPYYSRSTLFSAIDAVVQALKLPDCSRVFPRDIGKGRPCLNQHLGICEGWCTGTPDQAAYLSRIKDAILILDGKSTDVERQTESEMYKAADEMRFEAAANLRDRLRALSLLTKKQLPSPGAAADTDVIGFYRGEAKVAFVIMCYGNGKLLGKDYDIMELPTEDDGEAISSLIRQYYTQRGVCSRNILLPCELPDSEELSRMLKDAFGHAVELHAPRKGDKYKLVKLAYDNAFEEVMRATTKQERESKTLEWLKEHLKLPETLSRIEAYDISHTAGEEVVGGMVVFKDAKPLKRAYRRFKIKTVDGNDDYHSMQEVLQRRIQRFLDDDEKFAPLPELILLDGGGLLAAMGTELVRLMLGDSEKPIVYGMVKDDRHRTRALVDSEGNEVAISARPDVFSFIGRIQEETHRFAIEYHRQLRDQGIKKSALDGIPGVGDVRKDKLFKRFKNISAIKAASVEELSEVVPANVAAKIKEALNPARPIDIVFE